MLPFRLRPWLARQLAIAPESLVPVGEVTTPEGARELRYLRSGQYVLSVVVTERPETAGGVLIDAMWPDGRASIELEPGAQLIP